MCRVEVELVRCAEEEEVVRGGERKMNRVEVELVRCAEWKLN